MTEIRTRRLRKWATVAAASLAFGAIAVAVPLQPAQAYIGWDFGDGFGIGLGPPPSAYTACPNYGFGPECPYYPPPYYPPQ